MISSYDPERQNRAVMRFLAACENPWILGPDCPADVAELIWDIYEDNITKRLVVDNTKPE